MRRDNVNDLTAFIAVAREQSFTKAAAQLGVSQSALSYTIRTLEARLGLRLLTRTTRSVSLTEAGERLLHSIGPRFDEIEARSPPSAPCATSPPTIRITTVEHAAETILWPALAPLLAEYPDINVEIISDYGLKDIVADRYDAGVAGEQVDKDMISLRISADLRMAVVGAPPPSKAAQSRRPAGPDRAQLHQAPPADPRRVLCMGVPEGRLSSRCGSRDGRLQHGGDDAPGRARRLWTGLPSRGSGGNRDRGGEAGPGSGGLVPATPCVPPVLSEPPAALAGLCARD